MFVIRIFWDLLLSDQKCSLAGKYLTVFDKAVVYFESCARHHVFIDGNKRTAIALAARFLFLNGYELKATNRTLENFVLDAVVKRYDISVIAVWFKEHSKGDIKKR